MLDQSLREQIAEIFSQLDTSIALVYDQSDDQNQHELVEMLTEIASTSSRIQARSSGHMAAVPRFRIYREGKPTGIYFTGIPGGHEFSSLILAILNASGKGKLPDAGMQARIKRLNGPIRIQTFISLTCENCPDVVQALNQMALIHPDFEHEMVDGAYAQETVAAIGIQGVPSVVLKDEMRSSDSKMIHSGRTHFLDLLAKLESECGTVGDAGATATSNRNLGHFDVLVIGGGPAGASAAIYSARKGLKTALLAERMGGQVKDTKGIENLVSVIYTEGPMLAEQLYKHIASYPIQVIDQRRVKRLDKNKTVHLEGGESVSGDAVIVTTGANWRELGVPGEREYIGRGVAYCPHCDGPFYKGKKIAVIGGGNSGVEAALDLSGIAGEVVVFEFNEFLKADRILIDKLRATANISVVTGARTTELEGDGQKIVALHYIERVADNPIRLPIDGVFVQIGLLPNSGFARETLELTSFGEIVVDAKGRTSVPGIYAAGDVTTTPYKQIIIAMGEGARASLAAFEDRMYQ